MSATPEPSAPRPGRAGDGTTLDADQPPPGGDRAHGGADRDDAALDAYSRAVVSVAERLLPSVASVRHGAGSGSAVVLSGDGLLVTAAHVLAGGRVGSAAFHDGPELPYEVVGTDRLSDLAVVRVPARGLPAAELGDAARLRVGQLVVAVGSPLGFAGSVSAGVVSALGRSLPTVDGRRARVVEGVIQTDAALHPGNSGGALATSDGRVVGINTAVVSPGIGQGLGLAVPLDATTMGYVDALIARGRVDRAELGLSGGGRALPPRVAARLGRHRGVEVTGVVAGGPAARAGVRPEDIVVALDGQPVEAIGDMQRLLTGERAGRALEARVVRGGDVLDLAVLPRAL
ncbi:MAG TPA: trypsin-like peptidase domain-containing protein [Acidimicrobiales bacterium]